jgi:hypothetical protein
VRAHGAVGVALGLSLLAAGFRAVHLATPSLWWDEVVHISLATRPAAQLQDIVKWGPAPGPGGNAGAMPLDYLLLHAWSRATPPPSPGRLEAYWRLPSYVHGLGAVAAVSLLLARDGGLAAGALGGFFLALSVPAALYAAEARPYSLMVLLAVLTLGASSDLARRRPGVATWIRFALLALLSVAAGLPALFVVGAEAAVLVAFAIARGRARMAAAGIGATAAGLGLATAAWLRGIDLAAGFGHGEVADPTAIARTCSFLATGEYWHPSVALLAVAAAALAIAHATRRAPAALPLLALSLASFAALPALVLLVRWKAYYFHVRHALLLLPAFVVVLTHATLGAADLATGGRPRARALLAAALGIALALPPAVTFLRDPYRYFRWTKTVHDWRAAVGRLDHRPVLLVAENRSRDDDRAAWLGAWYVHADGVDDRVLLCSTDDLAAAERALNEARRTGDLGLLDLGCTPLLNLAPPGREVARRTGLGAPAMHSTRVPHVTRWALVAFGDPPRVAGLQPVALPGLVLLEPAR